MIKDKLVFLSKEPIYIYLLIKDLKLWDGGSCIVQVVVTKTIPKKYKCKKSNWLSEKALQIVRKEEKWKAKDKRKDTHNWMQSSRE